MLKCIAIDDEPLALRQITGYISKIPYLELSATFNNAIDAQQRLTEEPADLIFADINMPDLNGVDFVRALPDSADGDLHDGLFRNTPSRDSSLDAVDYLLKPLLVRRLPAARQPRPIRSTNCVRTDGRSRRRPLRRLRPGTRSTFR